MGGGEGEEEERVGRRRGWGGTQNLVSTCGTIRVLQRCSPLSFNIHQIINPIVMVHET